MICFDVENEDIFNETLSHHPKILFNPTWIPSPQSLNNTDTFLSDWRIGRRRSDQTKNVELNVKLDS